MTCEWIALYESQLKALWRPVTQLHKYNVTK